MLLKRKHYHDEAGIKAPVVSGIIVKRLPVSGKQKLSPKLIKTGQNEKWLSKGQDKITIHAEGGDVVFDVVSEPGRYCCHCGEKLADDATGEAARSHVSAEHSGKKSPDKRNPSGYEMRNYFDCKVA